MLGTTGALKTLAFVETKAVYPTLNAHKEDANETECPAGSQHSSDSDHGWRGRRRLCRSRHDCAKQHLDQSRCRRRDQPVSDVDTAEAGGTADTHMIAHIADPKPAAGGGRRQGDRQA
jgi:hypothetical protein